MRGTPSQRSPERPLPRCVPSSAPLPDRDWAERHRQRAFDRPETWLRLLAGALATWGGLWGFLLLIACPFSLQFVLVFGPGYVVTAGCLLRAISELSYRVRLAIWGASALLQGAWFGFALLHRSWIWLFLPWWGTATLLSIEAIGLEAVMAEHERTEPR